MSQQLARLVFLCALPLSSCQCDDSLTSLPGVGSVDGYVCDPVTDDLAVGVSVAGTGKFGAITTATDSAGYFMLNGLAEGPQTLVITGTTFSDTIEITVLADATTRVPDPPCVVAGTGMITGRICATEDGIGSGEGYWLVGARVYVTVGSDIHETVTDENGTFTLTGIPVGARTLHVEKGSFSAAEPVTVVEGEVARLDHVCLAPSTTIAVVTGVFDAIETVLQGMGFRVKACMPSDMVGCPDLDPGGTITLVDGASPYYITDFLALSGLHAQFDIIFFNCGLADEYFYSAPDDAKLNLTDFVTQGGSIYVSDRAYELLRVAFPGKFDFVGNEASWGSARDRAWVGMANDDVAATITDVTMARALRSTAVHVVYNKAGWVPLNTEQPEHVKVFLTGTVGVDIDKDGAVDQSLADAPLLVTTKVGNGTLSYTTFHMHAQANDQMQAILQYLVFEL